MKEAIHTDLPDISTCTSCKWQHTEQQPCPRRLAQHYLRMAPVLSEADLEYITILDTSDAVLDLLEEQFADSIPHETGECNCFYSE